MATSSPADLATLEAVQQRILWLAVRMVDHANHDRPAGEVKVGGHQASSASVVGIMTSLWFGHLSGDDKVAVKPHASPVYHAIKYLTGELDRSYLTRLRALGGLQAYPSRTKDPDVADFSTGSVGLGAAAPLFAAMARRYVEAHFGPQRPARFIALVGDAELDEGNIWEAIADPALQGLGNVTWIIDVNRQSLDRVIPGMKVHKLMKFFADSGWHVVEAKYGHLLQEAFARPGGQHLRRHIDDMSNEEYQSLFAFRGADLRERFLDGADSDVAAVVAGVPDVDLAALVQNLGGHDLKVLAEAYRACDAEATRPSVVFAYTVKGWGLPIAGDPLNHAALLSPAQIEAFRAEVGLTADTEWDRFPADSAEGLLCGAVGRTLNNRPVPPRPGLLIPTEVGTLTSKPVSTQETFGRLLTALGNHPDVAARLVTTSPDVSVSTNLGGWINKMGVFSPEAQRDFLGTERLLRWRQEPAGHHIELGISEMNLFLTLHALGLGHELHGEHLLPVGTVYDPFVCRGLDALIYALVQRRPLRRGGHAVGRLARSGGRGAPVDDHGVDRDGAARAHPGRAGLRGGAGLAAVRRAGPPRHARRRLAVPPPVDPPARPGALRRRPHPPGRRRAAGRRARRRLPAGRAGSAGPVEPTGRRGLRGQRSRPARGGGGRRAPGRRGLCSGRARPDERRPLLPAVASRPSGGRAGRSRRRPRGAPPGPAPPGRGAEARPSSPCTMPPATRWPGSARCSAHGSSPSAWTASASRAPSRSSTGCSTCCPNSW